MITPDQTRRLVIVVAMALCSTACQPTDRIPAGAAFETGGDLAFELLPTPAGKGSSTPTVHTTPDGVVLLSWVVARAEGGHALRFATLHDGRWSNPRTIAEGNHWFVNWADFPALISLGHGRLAAHFLARSGESSYAYDVLVTQSTDGGQTWSLPVRPHTDGTQTEHGFVSMLPTGEGALFATWLDGRNTLGHDQPEHASDAAMTLRAATLDSDGNLGGEVLLDDRTCDCCQTSAAATTHGIVVAYRNRSEGEIRDISIVRMTNGIWSEPQTVHQDGWELNGCPVNGPAIAAAGEHVAVAWFTSAEDTPRVKISFSSDGGNTFDTPIQVDDGFPLGRVHTLLLPDGSAVVSWMERVESGAEIRVRRIRTDGTTGVSSAVAAVTGSRAEGFPRMAWNGSSLYIAWTETGDFTNIRTAFAKLDS